MVMSPTGQDSPSLQFVQSKFSNTDDQGNPISSNYTPPTAQAIAAQVVKQQQAAAQNQDASQQSPIGMSPKDAGTIASKAFNSGFTNQVNSLNQFAAKTFGTMSPDTSMALSAGLGSADSAALGSTANFVNAAGDSVSADALPWGADAIAGQVGADGGISAVGAEAGAAQTGSLIGASATSILGAGALGALGGGFLADALGGNKLGGEIGGGLGAAAGMAFGGAGAAALGLELGSFAGPVGALVGGTVGAVAGQFIGNKTPATKASESAVTFNPDGSIKNSSLGSKNAQGYGGYASQLDSTLSDVMSHASSDLGIQFKDTSVRAGYNSMYGGPGGGFIQEDGGQGKQLSFDPNDINQKNAAIYQMLSDEATKSGYTDMTALKTWFDKATSQNQQQGFMTPATPTVQLGANSFASFMSKQGQTNASPPTATNGTPTV